MTLNKPMTVLFVAVLILSVTTMPAAGSTAEANQSGQNPPETPEEYLEAFESLDGAGAFEAYSELEVIRSQAIQNVQIGNFTDEKEQRMSATFAALEQFEALHQAEQDGSYQQAIDLANETREIGEELRSVDGGQQYALLFDIALDRFYEQAAQQLLNQAETVERTPDRIDVLSRSATAYNEAGEAEQFADVRLRVEQTRQRFEADYEQLNSSRDTLTGFIEQCTDCDSATAVITNGPFSVFGLYSDSQTARAASEDGISLANRHGLTAAEEQLSTNQETVDQYQQTLIVASAALVMGYSTIVALVAALFMWRLMLWRRDLMASQRGDVVLMGEMLNA